MFNQLFQIFTSVDFFSIDRDIVMKQFIFLAVNTCGLFVFVAVFAYLISKIFESNAFLDSILSMSNHAASGKQKFVPAKAPILGKPTPERPLGIELAGDELKVFLRSMNFDWTLPSCPRNLELELATAQVFEAEVAGGNLSHEALTQIRKWIPYYCSGAEMCYTNHPFKVRVLIASFLAGAIYVDDLCQQHPAEMVPELQRIVANWENKVHSYHPSLDFLRRLVTSEVPKYYGPLSTATIVSATINYMIGSMIECAYPKGISVPPTSRRFPRTLRAKTGGSEVYAHFIFSEEMFPEKEFLEIYLPTIPDIVEYTDMVNDIMSFYKESVVGSEQNTYLMTMGKALECSPVDILRDTSTRQARLAKDISATLNGKEELRKTWEVYRDGFLDFHCSQKRYRLSEIGINSDYINWD